MSPAGRSRTGLRARVAAAVRAAATWLAVVAAVMGSDSVFAAGPPAMDGAAATHGLPAPYGAIVVQPSGGPDRAEFDLGPALAQARREHRRLYVYLGASDCPYCRRYEAFLARNAEELVPRFRPWLMVDLRSSLSTTSRKLFIRVGDTVQNYTDFQRSINDERARMLVYPSVWVLDAEMKPLMQMPGGTGTFETVEEQLEILQLVQ